MPKTTKDSVPQSVDLVMLIDEPAWKTILIDLVEKEKMDVWAIDLVKLSQKYLERVRQMQESNLRVPANAILACAILLKLKSKTISLSFLKEPKEPELTEEDIRRMEDMLPELTPLTKVRESTVSLEELMRQIEAVIDKTKERSLKYRKGLGEYTPSFLIPAFNEKDLEEKIEELFGILLEKADEEGLVLFSTLLEDKTPSSAIDTFIPLLFLAHKQRIALFQESFFGEIFISLPKDCAVQKGPVEESAPEGKGE
ncbi:MAG: ScpA family protein [Candidatus Diapherotrites archaeon]|nr:ScpA family protein [Candidatus Diapherotrites archaeon]